MPRKHTKGRGTKSHGQRFEVGITSGVTITTIPSGITIYKGVLYDDDGNMNGVVGLSSGMLMVSGTTITKGTDFQVFSAAATPDQTAFYGLGLTTIVAFIATYGINTAATRCVVCVENGGASVGSHVTAHYTIAGSGVSYTSGISMDYIAIGT